MINTIILIVTVIVVIVINHTVTMLATIITLDMAIKDIEMMKIAIFAWEIHKILEIALIIITN